MKQAILILCGIALVVVCAFFNGMRIGKLKCQIKNAYATTTITAQIIETQGKINETVYRTGVRDVRRVLREKYTIAE